MTLPAAAVMGAAAAALAATGMIGVTIDGILGLAIILFIFLWSRRNRVGHDNAVSNIDNAGGAVRIKKRKSSSASARKKNASARPKDKEPSK